MKTLKEFTAERVYVAVEYDAGTQIRLRKWATDNGFDLTVSVNGSVQEPEDFDFHTTIFYTTNEVNIRKTETSIAPANVTVDSIKFLGENEDIPVIALTATGQLKVIRERFENQGLQDKWPTWSPHISLSYAKNARDVSDIQLPSFPISFNKLVIRSIVD